MKAPSPEPAGPPGGHFPLRLLLGLAASAAVLPARALPEGSRPDEGEAIRLEYELRMEGRPIGEYAFSIESDPENDLTRVRADLRAEVKIMFVPVYRVRHSRESLWRGSELLRLEGRSEYLRGDYLLRWQSGPPGPRLRVNDTVRRVGRPTFSFVPWRIESGAPAYLLTEKGNLRAVRMEDRGMTGISLDGGTRRLRHLRIEGDRPRDLYYDENDWLVLARYEKKGREIRIVRQEAPRPPVTPPPAATAQRPDPPRDPRPSPPKGRPAR